MLKRQATRHLEVREKRIPIQSRTGGAESNDRLAELLAIHSTNYFIGTDFNVYQPSNWSHNLDICEDIISTSDQVRCD